MTLKGAGGFEPHPPDLGVDPEGGPGGHGLPQSVSFLVKTVVFYG